VTKAEYLAELEKRLGALAEEERAELMADFAAHFDHGRAGGRTDDEIAAKLGAPQLVAREILYQLSVEEAGADPSLRRIARAVSAGVGVRWVNVLLLLAPFLAGLILLAGLFALGLYLALSPVFLLVQYGWSTDYLLMLPLAAGMAGAGLIAWAAAGKGTTRFIRFMLARLRRHANPEDAIVAKVAGTAGRLERNGVRLTADISAEGIRARTVTMRTEYGNIDASGLSGGIRAQAAAGDIRLKMPAIRDDIAAETRHGNIELVTGEAPEKLALDVKAVVGRETVDLPGTAIGDGSPSVVLRADVGDIAVRLSPSDP
jgi:uncharacterized membrane protein